MTASAWMLLAIALMSGMDAVAKHLASEVPVLQVVWLRYVFGVAFLLPVAWAGWLGGLRSRRPYPHLIRALLGLIVTACFFVALQRLPLSAAVAIWFTAPIFVIILGAAALKETVTRHSVIAVGLGFTGIAVLLPWPDGAHRPGDWMGYLAALAAAAAYAASVVMTRNLAATESQLSLSFYPALLGAFLVSPAGIAAWQPLDAQGWAFAALLGALGSMGYLAICAALARERAAALAPFEYTAMVWAVLFDLLVFDLGLSAKTIAGAAIIIVATRVAAVSSPMRRRFLR